MGGNPWVYFYFLHLFTFYFIKFYFYLYTNSCKIYDFRHHLLAVFANYIFQGGAFR